MKIFIQCSVNHPHPVIYIWSFQGAASVVVYSDCHSVCIWHLFILFRIAWRPSAELSSCLSTCDVLLYAVLIICVPFLFGVWGRMWNSIVAVPDHCLFILLFHVSAQVLWKNHQWQNQPEHDKNQQTCAQQRLRSTWASASLVRIFAVRLKKPWAFSYQLSAKAMTLVSLHGCSTDRILRWAHMSFRWFCRALDQMSCSSFARTTIRNWT